MGTTLTIKERAEMEAQYRRMLDDGLTVRQIADKLGISTQAVRKFLKVRGWTVKTS